MFYFPAELQGWLNIRQSALKRGETMEKNDILRTFMYLSLHLSFSTLPLSID